MGIPAGDGVVEPGDDVVLGLGMVALKRTPDQDALDGFGHVQPGATQRGIEWHDAVVEQPVDDRPAQVAGQVVPDQEESERRQRLGRVVAEPGRPPRQGWAFVLRAGDGWECGEHLGQLSPEPRVEHGVGRVRDPFGPHLAGRRTEQGQQFGRPATHVLMRLTHRLTNGCPGDSWLRNRLVRTGLVLAPDRQAGRFG